jgi:hypothetical protein
MNCPFEDKLILYLEKELSDDERDEFKSHLEECTLCKEDMKFFEKIEKDFHCEISLPDDFTEKIMDRIDERISLANILICTFISLLFVLIFFFGGYCNPMPVIGNIMVRLFFVLKDMPLTDLFFECLRQNITFLVSYSALIMAFITFFTIKKKSIFIKNYVI